MAQKLWDEQNFSRTGRQLRAAADDLEYAAKLSRQSKNPPTHEVINTTRTLSGKLIAGSGFEINEVRRGLETFGYQLETVGNGIEKPTAPANAR